MYYVYVLKSIRTGEYYKGLTNNIDKRLQQHLNKKVRFTSDKLPLKLVHVEVVGNRSRAREMEKFLKSGYGREVIKALDI
jgi:putative endonuclease